MTSQEGLNKTRTVRTWQALIGCVVTSIMAELIFGSFVKITAQGERCLIVFLTLFAIHCFASLSLRDYGRSKKDLAFLHIEFIVLMMIVVAFRVVIDALIGYYKPYEETLFLREELLAFAIPFAMGPLLTQAVLGLHYGLVLTLFAMLVAGLYFPDARVYAPFILVSGLVACLSLRKFRSRGDYLLAGVRVALVSIPFSLTVLAEHEALSPLPCLVALGVSFFGGLACSIVASSVTPVVEKLCGYVTDMRLLEIATLDHPLLKELSIVAPGTWNHSMVLGMMVEAAASEIGANPVLARVGAHFHDIGKVKKPLYFVENQAGGENRHDKLSTSMSALIIRSHVKDGVELARKHNVPEQVVELIMQHHGTSVIEYFYEKALKEAAEAGLETEVDKSLYTYAGPKPQSREAALLMLGDGIEAASRTLSEPTPDRIQGMVQKMINKVFASGELNESEITLKDLHLIAKTFIRVLNGIHHQRIAYAEPAEKVSEKAQQQTKENPQQPKAVTQQTDSKPEQKTAPEEAKQPAQNEENLKRLGISEFEK